LARFTVTQDRHRPRFDSPDPWVLRQIHDELDAMKEAGEAVPAAAYDIAAEIGHLAEDGVSPRVVAEHAVELARRVGAKSRP
jgi:hypothetical protein